MIKTILGLLGVDDASGPFTSNLKFTSGGTASTDANTLDAYVEGTFSPNITFGGGNTGIAYATKGGTYTRIGNTVFFTITLILTAKGSSTGALLVTSLPITSSNTSNFPVTLSLHNVTAGVGDSHVHGSVQANNTTIRLYKYSAGGQVQFTDADLTDTSEIRLSGYYRA
jgi:hypothetical protein